MENRGDEKVYAERICKAPIDIFGDDYLYHPLNKNGAPLELPNDVIGVIPVVANRAYPRYVYYEDFVNGWILVSKNDTKYTYRIGKGRPEIVLSNYDELEELDDIMITNLTYSFKDFLNYNHYTNKWVWDEWDRVMIGKCNNKSEYKVAKSVIRPTINKKDNIYGSSYYTAKEKITNERELIYAKKTQELQQEREALNKQKERNWSYLVDSFEKDFGTNDTRKIGDLNNLARQLGGNYFKRFIMNYHPYSYSDVQLACSIDYSACQKAEQYWNNQQANDAYNAYQKVQSRVKSKYDGEVRVLIIDKGTMRHEVYSKSHYNKYYKN